MKKETKATIINTLKNYFVGGVWGVTIYGAAIVGTFALGLLATAIAPAFVTAHYLGVLTVSALTATTAGVIGGRKLSGAMVRGLKGTDKVIPLAIGAATGLFCARDIPLTIFNELAKKDPSKNREIVEPAPKKPVAQSSTTARYTDFAPKA